MGPDPADRIRASGQKRRSKTRIATGSIGVGEAVIELEARQEDLADLNSSWAKLGTIDAHAAWSKEIDIVSGSTRWEVYRVV